MATTLVNLYPCAFKTVGVEEDLCSHPNSMREYYLRTISVAVVIEPWNEEDIGMNHIRGVLNNRTMCSICRYRMS